VFRSGPHPHQVVAGSPPVAAPSAHKEKALPFLAERESRLSLDAHHLPQVRHHFHKISLGGDHLVDVLVRRGDLIKEIPTGTY
jgi:hypothetical protein